MFNLNYLKIYNFYKPRHLPRLILRNKRLKYKRILIDKFTKHVLLTKDRNIELLFHYCLFEY